MASACSEKEKAASEAIAAANKRIDQSEAAMEALYERALASTDAEGREALIAGETDPALKAKATEMAAKMEDDEDEKKSRKYPVKVRPKVSAETPREAALAKKIAELEASPYAASMRNFRASLGLDLNAFDTTIRGMAPTEVISAYNLEAPLHAALQQAMQPPPGNMIMPGALPQMGQMAPPQVQAPLHTAPQNVPTGVPTPQYAASPQEFRL